MNWISVKDRLPDEEGKGILIYCPELERQDDYPGHAMMVSNRVYARKQIELHTNYITHWMELSPPSEVQLDEL